jgi:hypothetical protein
MTLRQDIQTELDKREGKRIAKEVLARMTEPPPPKFSSVFSGLVVMVSGAYITQVSGQSISFGKRFPQSSGIFVIPSKPFYTTQNSGIVLRSGQP